MRASRSRAASHLAREVGGSDGAAGGAVDVAALQQVRHRVVGHINCAVRQRLYQVLPVPRQPACTGHKAGSGTCLNVSKHPTGRSYTDCSGQNRSTTQLSSKPAWCAAVKRKRARQADGGHCFLTLTLRACKNGMFRKVFRKFQTSRTWVKNLSGAHQVPRPKEREQAHWRSQPSVCSNPCRASSAYSSIRSSTCRNRRCRALTSHLLTRQESMPIMSIR